MSTLKSQSCRPVFKILHCICVVCASMGIVFHSLKLYVELPFSAPPACITLLPWLFFLTSVSQGVLSAFIDVVTQMLAVLWERPNISGPKPFLWGLFCEGGILLMQLALADKCYPGERQFHLRELGWRFSPLAVWWTTFTLKLLNFGYNWGGKCVFFHVLLNLKSFKLQRQQSYRFSLLCVGSATTSSPVWLWSSSSSASNKKPTFPPRTCPLWSYCSFCMGKSNSKIQ